MSGAPVTVEHDYYGVPLWLMKDYLRKVGGHETGEDTFAGPGWQAALRKAEPRRIGSLQVGGTTATFTGEEPVLQALFDQLFWKVQRGGG